MGFGGERQLLVESIYLQSRAADVQDADPQRPHANVGCTSETGRRAGENAGPRMTAAG